MNPKTIQANAADLVKTIQRSAPSSLKAIVILVDTQSGATAFATDCDKDQGIALLKEVLRRSSDSPIIRVERVQ